MVQTVKQSAQGTAHYTVLRAIYMHGARVEVGASVELTPSQYAELKAANKVGPLVAAAPAKPAGKSAARAADKPADKPIQSEEVKP